MLSLFDGISCGQVALERAGIEVENYYASEIDKHAISITQKNYPFTIQLGDVKNWREWKLPKIDLIMAGSPCTYWTIAKNYRAKQKKETEPIGEGWDLFKQFYNTVTALKPTYFLFENNHRISKNIIDAITKHLGVSPILIDSSTVSAQKRKRLYWTNIPNITQPIDKGLLIKDIYEYDENLIKKDIRIFDTAVITDNYIKYDLSYKGHYSQQDRLYFLDGKAPTVPKSRTETKVNILISRDDISTYKKISPVEAERLQTLPDNYTYGLPKTRRFEAIGNGWTVDVIVHILRFMKH
ncbi:DNA cytosine methyltransferase [Candidatus Enterococcus murrayae]|uniref:DNA (cytosine-5-)-methyltransferase n=1 Tax=Candidatus Enterococcus murrayae TaxID=2815321 RepID=A0ABS3HBE6_9ENTE|nr:DNA cytosine methyltransferase [Enterococcus sp. MJM16]